MHVCLVQRLCARCDIYGLIVIKGSLLMGGLLQNVTIYTAQSPQRRNGALNRKLQPSSGLGRLYRPFRTTVQNPL